ncbi:MAG: thiamine-phosphate kinase [Oceanicaulis sp.]
MTGRGEFDFIAQALAPLTGGYEGAYGLKDDGAVMAPPAGSAFAVTSDTLVEGVHFPDGEDPAKAAWKALAANVSDLVAMAAAPHAYLLNIVWPEGGPADRGEAFVEGLRKAQDRFGLRLAGGDTTRARGPWMISITAFGHVGEAGTPRRGGAKAGDLLVVTNTIGDAWLGLQQHLGAVRFDDAGHARFVDEAFRRPKPPVEAVSLLRGAANAAIDVSDGLLADIGHLVSASGLTGEVDLGAMPVSAAARAWLGAQPDEAKARLDLATGGDDYQLVAAMPEAAASRFSGALTELGQPARIIGRLSKGEGVSVSFNGRRIESERLGFTHF